MQEQRASESTAALSAVDKAFAILGVLAMSDGSGLGVTAIAKESGVSKATAHRILKALVDIDVVYFTEVGKKYGLGSTLLSIGLAALRQLNVPKLARPYLEELASRTLETATLSMHQGGMRTYLDQVPSTQEIKMTVPIGMSFPLYAGASSKAILSTFTQEELDAYLDSVVLNPLTEVTPIDKDALRADVEEVKVLGYAVSWGERQRDAASVAAPVRGSDGKAFGSLSVSGPLQRFDRHGTRRLGHLVKETAGKLSGEIGYRA